MPRLNIRELLNLDVIDEVSFLPNLRHQTLLRLNTFMYKEA